MGNLGSVRKALTHLHYDSVITSDPSVIAAASGVILPGVGAFGPAMENIRAAGLDNVIKGIAEKGTPFLGICLGMQMMTRGSEESEAPGLGWVGAATHRFPDAPGLRVPHMGWNTVEPGGQARLFDRDGAEPDRFYFVHSYYVRTDDPAHLAAGCQYGLHFAASFEVDNLFGVQFHPEKSHLFGMKLLRRFAAL